MNTPAEEHLFEITLSQEGSYYLLRTYKIVRWLLGIATLASVFFLAFAVLKLIAYKNYNTHNSLALFVQVRVEPVVLMVASVVSFFQVFHYFRFSAHCRRGIETKQPEVFNTSFKWLFRHAVITLFLFVVNLMTCLFYCYLLADTVLKAKGSGPA